MTGVRLYGLAGCDATRRALRWLERAAVPVVLHDFRRDGLDAGRLDAWERAVGWERLLNRRGRTWRELPAGRREPLDRDRALELMLAQPSLIKRPVLELADGRVHVGFTPSDYEALSGRPT
ncbi:MAG TPA: ArsC/Spx/MgsR family protein [Gammaproteobacteria bacterium]|nr:ArsC/Spx/MgsR family protein [Gammaproteobacteria bacterium]